MSIVKHLSLSLVIIASLFLTSAASATPKILYFGVSAPKVDAESFFVKGSNPRLRFSFIVSDSAGLDKIAGAVLIDPVTQIPYGTFQAGAEKTAMQLDLTLDEIFEVRQFDLFGPRERIFTTTVFNEDGQSISQDLSVEFSYFDEWVNSQPFSLPGYDINFEHDWNISSEKWEMKTHRLISGKLVKGITKEFSAKSLHIYAPIPENSSLLASSPATFCKDVNDAISNMTALIEIVRPRLSYDDCNGAVQALDSICTYIGGQVVSSIKSTSTDGINLFLSCSRTPAFAVFESDDGSVRELRYLAQ